MPLAQVGRAERTFDHHGIAWLYQSVDMLGRGPSGHTTDMEFKCLLARNVRHRIVTSGSAWEREPSVLACRKDQRLNPLNDKLDTLDVVCSVHYRCHTAVQLTARMGWGLLIAAKPGDGRIRCRVRAAGKDKPLRLLFVRERKAAVIEKFNLAVDKA